MKGMYTSEAMTEPGVWYTNISHPSGSCCSLEGLIYYMQLAPGSCSLILQDHMGPVADLCQ